MRPGPHRAPEMRAWLDTRRCKRCGEGVAVEAIWADGDGCIPAGAPSDVDGRRQDGSVLERGWV